jgi:voltage-gated potassium channel
MLDKGLIRSVKAWHADLHEHRYRFLFTALLAYLILVPFVEGEQAYFIPILFFLMLYFVLDTLDLKPRVFWLAVSTGFTAMELHLIGNMLDLSSSELHVLELVVGVLYLTFTSFCVLILTRTIFSSKVVTGDTIRGGIAVYFLAGLAGAFFYHICLLVYPDAISGTDLTGNFASTIYFSFVTMTTLGFGDMTPQTPFLRTVVYLHAAMGQIYLAVLVARLVGLLSISKPSE